MDDRELLQAYAGDKSEGAFRTLVERHLPLVYSAALRQVGNATLAQDVTQVVFTVLARKAAALPKKTVLAGWLYQTTRYTAAKALRQECRRHRREQEALSMQSVQTESEWEHWAPFLDEAMAELAKLDREAVLLRYFRNKSLRKVGAALGINEDTAQKRVSRAVDKLRHLLLKRGVAISAVALTSLLATHAAQFAPAGLGASIAATALSKAAGSAPILALFQHMLRQSVWPKLGISAAAALTLAGLTGAVSHVWRKQLPQPPAYSLQSKSVLQPRAAPIVAASPTSVPQPASQPTPSDGPTPPLVANTTPQPRTGRSSLQLTPGRPMGITNASPRAPGSAPKLAFQTGLPRSANLTNAAPLTAESATNEFGSQQLPDAEWGGAGQSPFLARGGYGVNWQGLAPGQGMQVFYPKVFYTGMLAQASVKPLTVVQKPSAPTRPTAAKKPTAPKQ